MRMENGRVTETAIEARGARLGRPVLFVLGFSIAAVIVFFIASYSGVALTQ
jgi:hypothetical protein